MSVHTFDQPRRRERPATSETLRRSLDLLDVAERLKQAAFALNAAAETLMAAHAVGEPAVATAFEDAKRAGGDVFVALSEFQGNAALRTAHAQATGVRAVVDAISDMLVSDIVPVNSIAPGA